MGGQEPISGAMPAFQQDIRFTRSADGTRLAYAVHGDGFPLVRAAHWLTNIDLDWRTPVWRPWFDALGARYRFHRYDSRGCGLSDRDATNAELDRPRRGSRSGRRRGQARAIRAPRHLAGRRRVDGVRRSPSRARARARAPRRVRARAACAATRRPTELESQQAQLKLIEVGWAQDNPAFLQLFTNQIFPNATPEQVRSFNDLQRMSCTPEHAARLVASFNEIDASEYLPQIACPTLVLHTRGDMCAPFDEGLFIASSIPGARLVPLETLSHVPTPGEPSFERVIEEIEAFLSGDEGRRSPRVPRA